MKSFLKIVSSPSLEALAWEEIVPPREDSGSLYRIFHPQKTIYVASGFVPNELGALSPNETLLQLPFSGNGWASLAVPDVDYGSLNGWAEFAETKTELPGIHWAHNDLKIRGWLAYRPQILFLALQKLDLMGQWMKIHSRRNPDDNEFNDMSIALFKMRFKGTSPLGLIAQNVDNMMRARGEIKRPGQWLGENHTEPLLRKELLSEPAALRRAAYDAYQQYSFTWMFQSRLIKKRMAEALESPHSNLLVMVPPDQVEALRHREEQKPIINWLHDLSNIETVLNLQRKRDAIDASLSSPSR